MATDMMHRVLADLEKSIISFGEHTFFDKEPEETFPLSDYSYVGMAQISLCHVMQLSFSF
jgi:hypothetical protein